MSGGFEKSVLEKRKQNITGDAKEEMDILENMPASFSRSAGPYVSVLSEMNFLEHVTLVILMCPTASL